MPTKPAARTTKKVTPINNRPKVLSFDEKRAELIAKRGKTTEVFEWDAYGRTWHIKRPNPAVASAVESAEGYAAIIDHVLAHLVEGERDEFFQVLAADDELDLDLIMLMVGEMSAIVYSEIPTPPS